MIKKQINRIKLAIVYSFFIFMPFQKSKAMPPPRVYSYRSFSYSNLQNDLLNNRAVILTASNTNKRIILGNEKVAKRNRCLSIDVNRYHLQLHHIFFKAIRTTFAGIPYLCFQVPRRYHTLI